MQETRSLPQSTRLREKVALVTGAGGGLGRAIAVRLACEGATVIAADISGMQEETAAMHAQVHAARVDVTSESHVATAVDHAVATFGRLDVVCNVAGIDGPAAVISDYQAAAFDEILAVNVVGVFLGTKHASRVMTSGGSIINMASAAGIVGVPFASAYSASKGAVIQLTKSAAKDHGRAGIRVNAVAPGIIDAGMGERALSALGALSSELLAASALGRAGTADDVAAAFAFLASDDSAYITGAVVPVDGGWTA